MEDIYERLDNRLQEYADDEAACILGVSELDGFFHALACAPKVMPADVWMAAIWGGEEYSPQWRSEQERNTFLADVKAHHASVQKQLAHGECAPLFLETEEAGKTLVIPDAWCEGFLLGLQLWEEAEKKAPDELLEPIAFFAVDLDDPDGHEQMRAATPEDEVELLQELIPQSVFGLREFFLGSKSANNPAPRRGGKGGKPRRR